MACFFLAMIVNITFLLPLSSDVNTIFRPTYYSLAFIINAAVFMLYYNAMREIRTNANQTSRNIINSNRALNKAFGTTICVMILTSPLVILAVVEGVNIHYRYPSTPIFNACKLFAYITLLSNAFCSSILFLSINMPIRQLIRSVIAPSCSRICSAVTAAN